MYLESMINLHKLPKHVSSSGESSEKNDHGELQDGSTREILIKNLILSSDYHQTQPTKKMQAATWCCTEIGQILDFNDCSLT